MVNNTQKDKLERIQSLLKNLKEDFEMLQDGRWDMNYSDGTECEASIDNCNKIEELVKELLPLTSIECTTSLGIEHYGGEIQ